MNIPAYSAKNLIEHLRISQISNLCLFGACWRWILCMPYTGHFVASIFTQIIKAANQNVVQQVADIEMNQLMCFFAKIGCCTDMEVFPHYILRWNDPHCQMYMPLSNTAVKLGRLTTSFTNVICEGLSPSKILSPGCQPGKDFVHNALHSKCTEQQRVYLIHSSLVCSHRPINLSSFQVSTVPFVQCIRYDTFINGTTGWNDWLLEYCNLLHCMHKSKKKLTNVREFKRWWMVLE